jgi:hypothetical protein
MVIAAEIASSAVSLIAIYRPEMRPQRIRADASKTPLHRKLSGSKPVKSIYLNLRSFYG